MTLTQAKRFARPDHYAVKARRTEIYRALYGHAEGHDPQARPELNNRRKLPVDFDFQHVKALFETWAEKVFPPKRYLQLAKRLDALRTFRQ